MIAHEECIEKDFIIEMHFKLIYDRNALEKVFIQECIGNDFAVLEIILLMNEIDR